MWMAPKLCEDLETYLPPQQSIVGHMNATYVAYL